MTNKDLTGQRFGRLTVIKRVENNKYGHIMYLCQCDCGKQKNVIGSLLLNGITKSCGCYNKEIITKHGLIHHRIRSIYKGMKERCYNPNAKVYKWYGGKGITICQEWLDDLRNFYNWAMANGYQENLTIDRIDTSGNYCPENCRWVDMKTQLRNTTRTRLITYNNETMCLGDWAKKLNISVTTLNKRFKDGWSVEKTFTTPPRSCKGKPTEPITYNNKTQSISEWCIEMNLNYSTLSNRINKGWDIEKALTTPSVCRKKCNITYNGKTQTLFQWAKETGLTYSALRHRLDRGWDIEKILTTPVNNKYKKDK